MSSGSEPTAPAAPAAAPAAGDDRTARARIRDAAIACFADGGVARTTVRTVATAAAVSPALVMHHFGSKDRLRVACDQHVAALVREQKGAALARGAALDPLAAFRAYGDGPPVLRYLARTLTDGSPHVADLLDEMVADAVGYCEQAVASGVMRPSEDPRGRATVLVLWSLGALALHEHVERLLGVDLAGDPAASLGYLLPALEIVGRGVLADGVHEQVRASFRAAEEGSA